VDNSLKLPTNRVWIAGPKADELKNADEETIIQKAIDSLVSLFSLTEEELKANFTGLCLTGTPPCHVELYAYSP